MPILLVQVSKMNDTNTKSSYISSSSVWSEEIKCSAAEQTPLTADFLHWQSLAFSNAANPTWQHVQFCGLTMLQAYSC